MSGYAYANVQQTPSAIMRLNGPVSLPNGVVPHRSAYVSTPYGPKWLQVGINRNQGGKPFLYLEDSGQVQNLGPASPNQNYVVQMLHTPGGYKAMVNGSVVGSAQMPQSPLVAANEGYNAPPLGGISMMPGSSQQAFLHTIMGG